MQSFRVSKYRNHCSGMPAGWAPVAASSHRITNLDSCVASLMRQRPQLTPAALANGHRVPCGHEQNTPTMPRRRLFGSLGAK
jgi:hypothetical protein